MIIKTNNFDLKATLLSGQAFRIFENEDSSFDVVLKDRIINVLQKDNELHITSNINENLEKMVNYYFDLDRDYDYINDILSKDQLMKKCIEKCKGYIILKQDPFEIYISYIISQNNNVKRISSTVNKISEKYGEKVIFNDKEYYLFPTYDKLKNITLDELRNFGVGFRDKYIKYFLDHYKELKNLEFLSTEEALDKLMTFKGIGLKVASCILLFGYGRFDVFPIDTWVKKYIVDNYSIKNDQKIIKIFAQKTYDKYSGLAIQYMFHSKRNVDL